MQGTRKCAADIYGTLGLPQGFWAHPSAFVTCHRRWTLSKAIEHVKLGEWEWIWGAKKIKVYVGQGRERAHTTLGDNVEYGTLTKNTVLASEDGQERTPRSQDPCGSGSKALLSKRCHTF